MDVGTISEFIRAEFGPLANHFRTHVLQGADTWRKSTPETTQPGVYVFLDAGKVMKVGRHFIDVRWRARQHITDNTGGQMAALEQQPNAQLTLITLVDPSELHWAAALEVFLETKLDPLIKSKRRG